MLSLLCLLAFNKIKEAGRNESMWRLTFYTLATISFLTHYYMAVFIGAVYIFQKKYDKTITILESILNQKLLEDKSQTKSRITDNLGYAYFKKGSDQKKGF